MAYPDLISTWNRLTAAIYYGNDVASGTLVPVNRTISTTPPITGGGDLSANRTIGITLTGGGSGAVGTGTTISTTAPLTGGGDLSANRTLALTTSPVGQTPVGTTRLITTTTPLKIDGGASANLSADRTLSVIPFTGALDGIVTHNAAGVQGKFLKDDNTWGNSAVMGVSSVSPVAPILVSPTTGDIFISITPASILTSGVAPATGGADGTKFLSATNPVTWAVPGLGNYLSIQTPYPGTAEGAGASVVNFAGNFVVERITLGSTPNPVVAFVGGYNAYNDPGVSGVTDVGYGYQTSVGASPADTFQRSFRSLRSRGTMAVPTPTADNDFLGSFTGQGYTTLNGFDTNLDCGLWVRADGAPTTTVQKAYVDIISGQDSNLGVVRHTNFGTLFLAIQSTLPTSDRPVATVDVGGSFALKTTLKTAAGAVSLGATDQTHLVDASSSGSVVYTVVTAVGCLGRRYHVEKVDSGLNTVTFNTSAGQTISGAASGAIVLYGRGQYIEIVSDGSNWWLVSHNLGGLSDSMTTPVTVANTVTATGIGFGRFPNVLWDGTVIRARMAGKYSNTGTPTLRFRFTLISTVVVGDTGAITTTSGATDWAWESDMELLYKTVAGSPTVAWLRGTVSLQTNADGTMTTYNMALASPGNPASGQQNGGWSVEWSAADPSNTITGYGFSSYVDIPTRVS